LLSRDFPRTGQPAVIRGSLDEQASDNSVVPVVAVVAAATVTPVETALAGCEVRVRRISDPSMLPDLRRDDACGIALVAIDGEPPHAAAIAAVRVLGHNGFTVLCCWLGAGKWALGVQCSLLVAGASHLLDATDPAFGPELRECLERVLKAEVGRQNDERRIEQQMLELGIVGTSGGMNKLFRWVLRASPLSDLPVLIVGETGTGKELIAHAIHRLDPRRRSGPFVPVNCGAIHAGLAESELFGHRRGAFTGAERDRKGLVRTAFGGVLFLDEIGDLNSGLQGKLLRVLQEHRVLGLGEDHEVPVDVRIIAATNRNLEEMVRQGAFRADLFHRLNVLSVRVPALRERPDDIEPLIRHFLAACAREGTGRALSPTDAFLDALKSVSLPGNIRQLENLVRRACLVSQDDARVRLNALPAELLCQLAPGGDVAAVEQEVPAPVRPQTHESTAAPRTDAGGPALDPVAVLQAHSWNLERSLDFCEQKIVTAALGLSSGNRSRAAKMLGISPRSIFNKMRRHRRGA
jgi:DNA-binding NtrC family response regulator